ncbi:hypothetical protein G7Y89_g10681 [Cudoniella acicularis]|uniref:Uncharacterized protein n=1 Tax=Cudoniella acicularis TaxID=354080 RepID=A0A8H4W0Q3_9HELO|nr:hypothetical protein G7Y89_g10681 [Cudoniella acicularis]
MKVFNRALGLLCLFSLTHATNAIAVKLSQVSTATKLSLETRADMNLTALTNVTALIQELDFTNDCTVSIPWYKNLPNNGAGFGNDTLNVEFLRTALPPQYEDATDAEVAAFYNELSFGALSDSGWIGTAKDDIETGCIAPQFERQISLSNLNATQNCTATAIFLSSLGWLAGPQSYNTDSYNDSAWLGFLYAALPPQDQNNITQLELFVYRNFFLTDANTQSITTFLDDSYYSCQKDICMVQGYTGNPDISGIGVMISYSVEAVLVTLYFAVINLRIFMKAAGGSTSKIHEGLKKSSDGLLNGALFFSLSISSAGWVSFHSGRSYYEKLVFTSANILALSALFALFAFIVMFAKERYLKKGDYIIEGTLLGVILLESTVQYIVYLREPTEKYQDYECLHAQFLDKGYRPTVFEALFFLLLGLSILAGIVALLLSLTSKGKEYTRTFAVGSDRPTSDSAAWLSKRYYWLIWYWIATLCADFTRVLIQVIALVVMWVELIYLWRIRHIMSNIAGNTWSEGAWGFGQILALFVWLPPVLDLVMWLALPRKISLVDMIETDEKTTVDENTTVNEKKAVEESSAPVNENEK